MRIHLYIDVNPHTLQGLSPRLSVKIIFMSIEYKEKSIIKLDFVYINSFRFL